MGCYQYLCPILIGKGVVFHKYDDRGLRVAYTFHKPGVDGYDPINLYSTPAVKTCQF
jgi:hypothetical protein